MDRALVCFVILLNNRCENTPIYVNMQESRDSFLVSEIKKFGTSMEEKKESLGGEWGVYSAKIFYFFI